MQIEGLDSSWVMTQQAGAIGAKSMAEAESFADKLQRATEELESAAQQSRKSVNKAAVEMTPEELKYDKKLREACKGFEAMFLNIMYKEMRDTVPENTLFGNSNADKILQSMLDTEMVNKMAEAGGVGLGDMIYKQITMDNQARKDMAARAAAANQQRMKSAGIDREA